MTSKITLIYRNTYGVTAECSIEEDKEMTVDEVIEWLETVGLKGLGF